METIIGILEAIGVFVAGLVARIGVVLAVALVLLVPVFLVIGGARALAALRRRALGLEPAGGLLFRRNLYYAPGHTWVKPDAGKLRVGIDDLAQHLLPWATAVELPRPGTVVKRGDPVATIACGGKQARIGAPVDGTVIAVNPAVARDPSLVKRDSYARGWLFAMVPSDDAYRRLPTGEPARGWFAAEGARLGEWFEHHLGIATADGGEWIAPPPALVTDEQWRSLTGAFLRAA